MARALILVRNGVTHDARVLREAQTLRGAGFETLIAGVATSEDRPGETVLAGTRVLRLDPAGALGRLRGVISRTSAQTGSRSRGRPVSGSGPGGAGRSPLRRLLVTAVYNWQGIGLLRRSAPDLIHANDYNTMWIGVAGKLLRRSRLIYDCHELWPDRNGRPEWRPWLVACEWLFVRAADVTLTTSPGYADVIARRYRVPRPLVVRNIPQSATPAPAPSSARAGGLGMYIGGVMPGRGLEQAIRALPLARGIRLRLIGPGREGYRQALRDLAEAEGVSDRAEILSPVSPSELVHTIAAGDFGLMLIEPVCLSYELTLPNKLFEYAAAGLPILSSDLPVIGRVVREHGLGRSVSPLDPGQIASAMHELCQPEINSGIRRRVAAFARTNTWEHERQVLEGAYRPDPLAEPRRVQRVYASYSSNPGKQRSWSAGNPGNTAIRTELVEAAFSLAGGELRQAEEILDAGCGTGWWLQELDQRGDIGAQLHGIDVLPLRVSFARHRVPAARISVADVRSLPFVASAFDVVSLLTVLSSLGGRDDIRQAVGEARRVLRPGGALLIWEPRVPNPLNRRTVPVPAALLGEALAGMTVQTRTTTVLPALSRRLGGRTARLYPWLARVEPLRTHRLVCARMPPG